MLHLTVTIPVPPITRPSSGDTYIAEIALAVSAAASVHWPRPVLTDAVEGNLPKLCWFLINAGEFSCTDHFAIGSARHRTGCTCTMVQLR